MLLFKDVRMKCKVKENKERILNAINGICNLSVLHTNTYLFLSVQKHKEYEEQISNKLLRSVIDFKNF